MKPLILLTNDDGYVAEGIQSLRRRLRSQADVFIVAPDREKSAASLSLTLRRPLRVQRITRNVFAVDGTPADCVYLALKKLLPRPPGLLISGLNHGPNLGQQDISYSGTVAAALQGTFLRVPSLAVSVLPGENGAYQFDFAAGFAAVLAARTLQRGLPPGLTLNINIPPGPVRGVRISTLGEKRYDPEIIEKKDPRENVYYWIGSGRPKALGGRATDVRAVGLGYISVTPLHTDLTDYKAIGLPFLKTILQGLVGGPPGGDGEIR
jgi:5'-nucleotidase